MNLQLEKPLVCLDIESTGTDPVKDRIVTLSMALVTTGGSPEPQWLNFKFNPGFPMSPEVIECHGITNDMVKDWPRFTQGHADSIVGFLRGCDLLGFNLLNFDLIMLAEECDRVGVEFSIEGRAVIDVGNIFKKKERRDLTSAVKFYCGNDHEFAHSADGDVAATLAVLDGQIAKYDDLLFMDVEQLAEFSHMERRVDIAGKIVLNKDGVPCFSFGNSKGVPVVNDRGFALWMLGKDFPADTKRVIRRLLK